MEDASLSICLKIPPPFNNAIKSLSPERVGVNKILSFEVVAFGAESPLFVFGSFLKISLKNELNPVYPDINLFVF